MRFGMIDSGMPTIRQGAERDRFLGAAVLNRYSLEPGAKIIGPAIVEERESTVVIGVGGTGIVDRSGALVVSMDG